MNEKVVPVKIYIDKNALDIGTPQKATEGSSGYDLHANIESVIKITPGDWMAIDTGIRIELGYGYEAQIRPRSGFALYRGITIPNSPGTIDSDYRGPVKVILKNDGHKNYYVKRGDRIAQMVIQKLPQVNIEFCYTLEGSAPTKRGEGGFGSSGV